MQSARRTWRRIPTNGSWDRHWTMLGPTIAASVAQGQRQATNSAAAYVDEVLAELGLSQAADGSLRPASLVGVASDGRDLTSLFYGAIVRAGERFEDGLSARAALNAGGRWLDMAVETQIMDAARVAAEVEAAARPAVTGFVRMVSPGACARCIVLAGRFYRYDAGFLRHPRCRCIGIPASENVAGDVRTNPSAYFHSLSAADQDDAFGKAGAEAIRLGADIGRVVNARRGMSKAQGRDALVTSTRTRGNRRQAVRLMPETILQEATSRDDAVRLLNLHGYLT